MFDGYIDDNISTASFLLCQHFEPTAWRWKKKIEQCAEREIDPLSEDFVWPVEFLVFFTFMAASRQTLDKCKRALLPAITVFLTATCLDDDSCHYSQLRLTGA